MFMLNCEAPHTLMLISWVNVEIYLNLCKGEVSMTQLPEKET